MTVGLLILVGFMALALVACCALALVAAGKDRDRLYDRDRAQMRLITARLVTDELGPGAELRALIKLQREDVDAATLAADPLIGRHAETDEMVERRSRRQNRDINDGLIDDRGEPIHPTGSQ